VLVFAATGVVAAVSAGVLTDLHPNSQAMTVTLTAALALAAGVVFLVGGLVKLGWIVSFISKAVMAGFIMGLAIQIIVGQPGHLTGPLPRRLVIDFEEVFYTDSSGAESIRGLKRYASRYDVQILMARLHADARQTLAQDGMLAEIGEDHIYDSVQAAVAAGNEPAEQQDMPAEQTEQDSNRVRIRADSRQRRTHERRSH
jgi:MFS superfamily sulfate permease-like transporter